MEKGSLFPVYLKKGDKAEIAIDKRRMTFVRKQTPEDIVLASWTNFTQELKVKAIYFMEPPLSWLDGLCNQKNIVFSGNSIG